VTDIQPVSARGSRWPVKPTVLIGCLILAGLLSLSIAPKLFAPYDPLAFDTQAILNPPSLTHPFGTDNFGRDMLSRVIWAARVDLQMALFATLFPMVVGTLLGAFVGYYGGLLDTVVGRVIDAVVAFPFLVLIIAIVAVLGPGLVNMYIAVGTIGWVFYTRLMRAETLVQKQMDYCAAARLMGYSHRRIMFRHLLPNTIIPIVVFWMTNMALVILLGSSLGFLGLGAQPPEAEWGALIAEGKNFITTAWWITVFPGIAIVAAGNAFSLVGDGIADILRRRD
jgi:peptide/nickel transport system permease protein